MSIALTSLLSLTIAILIGRFSRINVGILAMGFAWIIGYYLAGMTINTIVAGYPIGIKLIKKVIQSVGQHQAPKHR